MQTLQKYLNQHLNQACILSCFDKINSTNDFLLNQTQLSKDIHVCITNTQTSGRGQYQRLWQDSPNGSLLFSVAYPFAAGANISGLSLVVGLSIVNTLKDILNLNNLSVKWPNDIYANGEKLAGILIENKAQGQRNTAVIGVGINVNFPDDFSCQNPFVDLNSLLEIPLTTQKKHWLLTAILNQFFIDIAKFEQQGFAAFKSSWLKQNYLKDKTLSLKDGLSYQVSGVADDGALMLLNKQKTQLLYNSSQITAINPTKGG